MATKKLNPILLFVLIAASFALQACGVTTTAAPTETIFPTTAPTETTIPSPTPTRKPTATQAPTFTPTPVAPAQSQDLPSLGSADETLAALETGVPDLGVGADSKESSANGLTTIQYDVLVKEAGEPYIWRTGWCAADTNELKGILSNLRVNLRVNGQEIDLTKTHFGEYPFGQQVCFSFFIVMSDWPDGVTVVEDSTRVVKEFTQNGYTYNQGLEYVTRYVVSK